jgi:hypothetical protein
MAPDTRINGKIVEASSEAEPVDLALVVTEKPLMRLELREVDGLDLTPPLVLAGIWAWLLFHEAGTLISYSDGYATRSACHAAAKQIAWPVNVFE